MEDLLTLPSFIYFIIFIIFRESAAARYLFTIALPMQYGHTALNGSYELCRDFDYNIFFVTHSPDAREEVIWHEYYSLLQASHLPLPFGE